jgi:hypothetical protein
MGMAAGRKPMRQFRRIERPGRKIPPFLALTKKLRRNVKVFMGTAAAR